MVTTIVSLQIQMLKVWYLTVFDFFTCYPDKNKWTNTGIQYLSLKQSHPRFREPKDFQKEFLSDCTTFNYPPFHRSGVEMVRTTGWGHQDR